MDPFSSTFPRLRFFRLGEEGVRCGEDGLFVGAVPLLRRSPGGSDLWAARPADELDRDLGDLYGLPIDVASKRRGWPSWRERWSAAALGPPKTRAQAIRSAEMSTDDYASLSIPRLLELYAEGARKVGVGRAWANAVKAIRSGIPSKRTGDPPGSEMKQGVAAIRAIEKVLRERGAISEIRGFFEDDDADVRMCAVGQFADIDPESARAADRAVLALLPTREVLALRRRARQASPRLPTLKEMSGDALVERFEDAATREGASQFLDPIDEPEDQATQNLIAVEIVKIMKELKARGLLSRLAPSLSSQDLNVRWRAAQGCLRLAEQRAIAALESVIASGSFDERLGARETLDDWREGKCLVDGL